MAGSSALKAERFRGVADHFTQEVSGQPHGEQDERGGNKPKHRLRLYYQGQ